MTEFLESITISNLIQSRKLKRFSLEITAREDLCRLGRMPAYRKSFIIMVQILLDFIKIGDWLLQYLGITKDVYHKWNWKKLIQKFGRNLWMKISQWEISHFSASLSLYDPDGTSTFCKTAKSKLYKHLKKSVPIVAVFPSHTPKIFDSIVLLQKLPPTLKTLGVMYLIIFLIKSWKRIV